MARSILEDVRSLKTDGALHTLTHHNIYPTSDALGDWLRRHGGTDGEQRAMRVNTHLLNFTADTELTLDIDATIIQADKGDATVAYEGARGYHPLLGIIADNAMIAASEFRYGNESPQAGLEQFIKQCQQTTNNRIRYIRSDSAGYNSDLINYCTDKSLLFTITADHDSAVMHAVENIPKSAWKRAKTTAGNQTEWQAPLQLRSRALWTV
jgi:hypothetical protein